MQAYTPHMVEQENFQKNCANVKCVGIPAHFGPIKLGFAMSNSNLSTAFAEKQLQLNPAQAKPQPNDRIIVGQNHRNCSQLSTVPPYDSVLCVGTKSLCNLRKFLRKYYGLTKVWVAFQ
jgi:hypothetical protein